ncbi:MAG TPA: hypothetical protein VFZ78_04225, partial [Flavisolibacter sp.]
MKKLCYAALAVIICSLSFSSTAQVKKCLTDQKMQELFQSDPQARLRYENTQLMLDQKVKQILSNPALKLMKTNAIMTVPVVVHIVYANPTQVTDATVANQIDTLNKYYSGGGPNDSLRVYTPFRTTYGRSQIRFCMA